MKKSNTLLPFSTDEPFPSLACSTALTTTWVVTYQNTHEKWHRHNIKSGGFISSSLNKRASSNSVDFSKLLLLVDNFQNDDSVTRVNKSLLKLHILNVANDTKIICSRTYGSATPHLYFYYSRVTYSRSVFQV